MRLVFLRHSAVCHPYSCSSCLRAGHAIELVVTQPDRVRGRDQDPSPPPVKMLAGDAGLPVVQPEKIKNNPDFRCSPGGDPAGCHHRGRLRPHHSRVDAAACRRLGNLNLHASLLPKYRGAAPIQWAVANGESVDRGNDHAHR